MASKLKVNRGTTFTITFNYKKNDVPATLVGATLFFTVKSAEFDSDDDDSTAIVLKTITSHTDAPNGISTITLLPEDTDLITPDNYFYDLKVKEAGGNIYKVAEGKFILDGSPTNRLT